MARAMDVVPAEMGRGPARAVHPRFHRFRPALAAPRRTRPRPASPTTGRRHRIPRTWPYPGRPDRCKPRSHPDPRVPSRFEPTQRKYHVMIVLGIVLLILGFVLSIPILWTIGIILIIVGAIFAILGATGRAIGGRKHWY